MTTLEMLAESSATGVVDFYIDKVLTFDQIMYYANFNPAAKKIFIRKFLMLYFSKTTEFDSNILTLLNGIKEVSTLEDIIYSSVEPARLGLKLFLAQKSK